MFIKLKLNVIMSRKQLHLEDADNESTLFVENDAVSGEHKFNSVADPT